MENNNLTNLATPTEEWFSDDFIYRSLIKYLKENGYNIQKETGPKDPKKPERSITATRYFKKEIIEVKGYPQQGAGFQSIAPAKTTHAKSWFTEALFNSFVNFSRIENAEVAIALPNVPRYQAIIQKLNDYFTANDLYFKIYLVNEDSSVELSNLNTRYAKVV